MFKFENPEQLNLLILIPVFIGFFIFMWGLRKRALQQFGETELLKAIMPQVSRYKHITKFILLLFAVAFLVIGLANPQWGTKKEKVKRKSVDVFIALDISQSMMAQDVPPNRLERAQRFAQNLIDELKGERIGNIIFAGNAYLQVPLTTDYAAAQLFIKSANTNMAPAQGLPFRMP